MRSPGCTMATPMKPLVEPTVAGVSMARRSPPRRRLGSTSLRSTILGRDVITAFLRSGPASTWGLWPPRPADGSSGLRGAAVGDEVHPGELDAACELAVPG